MSNKNKCEQLREELGQLEGIKENIRRKKGEGSVPEAKMLIKGFNERINKLYVEVLKYFSEIHGFDEAQIILTEDTIGDKEEGVIRAGKNSKWLLVNKLGEPVVEEEFAYIGFMYEGLAVVKSEKNGLYFFINSKGEREFGRKEFVQVQDFSEGYAAVKMYNKGWYFINKEGERAIDKEFDHVYEGGFTDGVAKVVTKEGYDNTPKTYKINKKGERVD